MSVPPVTSSLQVPVGQPDSVQAPDAMTSDTTVSTSSSGPVLPVSYLVRDSEQITASEALLVLQEGSRASESSLLAETIPETEDIPHTPDVPQPSDVSQDFVELWRPTLDHSRPSRTRCGYIATPLHTYG